MDILYISSLCSKEKFSQLFKSATVKPAQQAQKYHQLMVEGLNKNKGTSITVISSVPVNPSISSQVYYKSEIEEVNSIEYRYLSFINWPILRHIFLFVTCFFSALTWCLQHKKGVVICDVLNITVSGAALVASKLTRTISMGIVTDVPAILARMCRDRIDIKAKIVIAINTFIMNRFNSYVFLTEYMSDLINKKQKPYVVIEGQVDINMGKIVNDLSMKYDKKVCIYAGALHKIYGIKSLTDAFIAAGLDNAELHIYGSGDFEEELAEICKKYTDIKYFGVVPNNVVVNEQLKATLLINPRPTNQEYTKYSFPSKNMEYMVSGTPILTTKLLGMPRNYYSYVYLIEEETVKGLSKKLKEILIKPPKELHRKGLQAKKFMLKEKNNSTQASRILELARDLLV